MFPQTVVSGYSQPLVAAPLKGRVTPKDLIAVPASLLHALGYSENDPHPWWDKVLQPGSPDRL